MTFEEREYILDALLDLSKEAGAPPFHSIIVPKIGTSFEKLDVSEKRMVAIALARLAVKGGYHWAPPGMRVTAIAEKVEKNEPAVLGTFAAAINRIHSFGVERGIFNVTMVAHGHVGVADIR